MISSLLLSLALVSAQTTEVPVVTPTIPINNARGPVCISDRNPKTPKVSAAPITINFRNTMNETVNVCWSNFAGNRKRYGKLQPNQELAINTFVGHIWNFRLADGKGCNGKALSAPMSFKRSGLNQIGDLVQVCPVTGSDPQPTPVPTPVPTTIVAADYQDLEKSLKEKFVTSANIPKLVRMSFHDLANFDPATNAFGGAHGCIFNETVMSFSENNGLKPTAADLTAFMETNFPTKNFPMGDVISLAGKVAAETAFPGTSIKWRFGRSACKQDQVAGKAFAPSPAIKTIAEMQPFLDRYSLTANEMAILTSGAHSIAGAQNFQADTGIVGFTLSTISSGIQFIKDSQDSTKVESFFQTWYGTFKTTPVFGRFPSDMLFFPSTVSKVKFAEANSDPAALPVEKFLNSIPDDASFNAQFAKVYAKMLEIGVATETLTAFN